MLVGDTPFYAETLVGTYGKIMDHTNTLEFPPDDELQLSADAKDVIRSLLCAASGRLGRNGVDDFKAHPFFAAVDWDTIADAKAPYTPEIHSETDTSNFEEVERDTTPTVQRPANARAFVGLHLPFAGFTFTGGDNAAGTGPGGEPSSGDSNEGAPLTAVDALKHKSLMRQNSLLMVQNKMLQRVSQKRHSAESPARPLSSGALLVDSPLSKQGSREDMAAAAAAADLRAKTKDIEQLERRLADSNQHLKEALKSKSELGSQLTAAEQAVAEKDRAATALRTRLQEMESEMTELEETNLRQRQDLKRERQDAEDARSENDALQDWVERATALARQQTSAAAETDRSVVQLQELLDEARVALRAADARAQEWEERHDAQATALAQERARATGLEMLVQQQPHAVPAEAAAEGSASRALLAAQAEADGLRAQLEEREAAAERKAATYNEQLERYAPCVLACECAALQFARVCAFSRVGCTCYPALTAAPCVTSNRWHHAALAHH